MVMLLSMLTGFGTCLEGLILMEWLSCVVVDFLALLLRLCPVLGGLERLGNEHILVCLISLLLLLLLLLLLPLLLSLQ